MHKILDGVAGVIFPRRCPACHDIVSPRGQLICETCKDKFSYVDRPLCFKCGKMISAEEKEYCYDCAENEKPFVRNVSAVNYDTVAQKSMVMFKYKGRREYAKFYAEELMRVKGTELREMMPELIIPVPVHRKRYLERGYNQASELAKELSALLGVPMRDDILIREKATKAQKELTAENRVMNLLESMRVRYDLSDFERILLVDDIYTTGSTLTACTRALMSAGAKKVYTCTFCIGKDS